MMNRDSLYPGQVVLFQGTPARVDKINPKSVAITRADGTAWRVGPFSLDEVPEGTVFELDDEDTFVLGQPVRFKAGTPSRAKYDFVLVVIAKTSDAKYRLARLGGDGDRYYRGVGAAALEKTELIWEAE